MKILVTGGCGFLGSQFIRARLRLHTDDIITNVDCLTYAGSLYNLQEANQNHRHTHISADIADHRAMMTTVWQEDYDLVIHFAAETHVDRSLEDASRFVRTNVQGTQLLLENARRKKDASVIVISTDEVYGPTPKGAVFGIGEPLRPTSPYAASKAGADWMALAYRGSFDLDVSIVRSVNVYGPHQYPEKLIPLFTSNALSKQSLPLYGHGRQRRRWLCVDDFLAGVMAIVDDPERRREKPIWHLGSDDELENREIAKMICELCEADPALITLVTDRPGHDQRYALDYSQTQRIFGWSPATRFSVGLAQTVQWIRENLEWCRSRQTWTPDFLRDTQKG